MSIDDVEGMRAAMAEFQDLAVGTPTLVSHTMMMTGDRVEEAVWVASARDFGLSSSDGSPLAHAHCSHGHLSIMPLARTQHVNSNHHLRVVESQPSGVAHPHCAPSLPGGHGGPAGAL